MKSRRNIVTVILFLSLASVLVYALLPAMAPAGTSFPKAEGIDVFNVVSDPYAYKGEITVRGGVMSVDPTKKLFNMVDYREYRACRSVDCAPAWTTVLYNGKLPERTNVVEMTGVIEKNPAGKGGYILRAKGVKVK